MKKFLTILCLAQFLGTQAFAFSWPNRFGAELAAQYLSQNGDGETYTVLPMLNYRLLENENRFQLNVQVGGTSYMDDASDDRFFVGVARVNPIYKMDMEKITLEGLFGAQYWDMHNSIKPEVGARANYDVQALTSKMIDEVFAGGGVIFHSKQVIYATVGFKKWF